MGGYGYIPPRELELMDAIQPWAIDYEKIGEKYKPILKPDAPEEIVKMRDEFWELILAYKDPERIEDFFQ